MKASSGSGIEDKSTGFCLQEAHRPAGNTDMKQLNANTVGKSYNKGNAEDSKGPLFYLWEVKEMFEAES